MAFLSFYESTTIIGVGVWELRHGLEDFRRVWSTNEMFRNISRKTIPGVNGKQELLCNIA